MKRSTFAAAAVVCVTLGSGFPIVGQTGAPAAPPPQNPPTFRSGVNVVPLDVRVLDRDGKPVTDLTQQDFTVLENGVIQPLRHFSTHDLGPRQTEVGAKPAFRTRGASPLQAQTNRVFLIVMGRGRLQVPSKGVDAVIDLVKSRLLPQDQVAVFAYNRASGFTNDHAKVVGILERFKKSHESIESRLKQQMGGLAAVYGSRDIPQNLQADIAAIFGSGAPDDTSRQVPPPPEGDPGRLATVIQGRVNASTDAMSQQTAGASLIPTVDPALTSMDIDGYVALSTQTLQDVGNLYTGIEYLRYLEGEKHIVFLTEQGLYMPRAEAEGAVAARASNARVAIDVIQTGGVDTLSAPAIAPASSRRPFGGPIPTANFSTVNAFRAMGTRNLADLTGGQAWFYQNAGKAIERLDQTSRFWYLLGYNAPAGRGYRRITVRVNRPDVKVLYRHGYYTTEDPPPIDRRTYLTDVRLAAAATYARDVDDIKIVAKAARQKTGQGENVTVSAQIDISRVAFAMAEDRHAGELDVMIYCGDDHERVIGRLHQKIDLKLKDETYQRFLKEGGISYTGSVPVRGEAKSVKVVVYDFGSDLVGSLHVKVK